MAFYPFKALSTSCITSLSSLALLFLLSKKICGIFPMFASLWSISLSNFNQHYYPASNFAGMEYIKEVINPLLRLLPYCIFSGFITMISYKLLHLFLSSILILRFFHLCVLFGHLFFKSCDMFLLQVQACWALLHFICRVSWDFCILSTSSVASTSRN